MIKCEMGEFMELSEEVLNREHYLRFRMQGVSMLPFMRNNDIIKIKKMDASKIRPGDIIFFRTPSFKGVTHRVIKKIIVNGKIAFITKGDSCPYFDGYVYPEDMLGKIIVIERKGKNIKLDKGIVRLKNLFYAKILSFHVWAYSILRKIKRQLKHRLLGGLLRKLQGLRIYIYLIKILIGEEKIIYRVATYNDVPSLARLYRTYYWPAKLKLLINYFQRYLKHLSENYGYCFLAQERDKVIGSVAVKKFSENEIIPSGWAVCNLFVNWRYRGRGIERQLVDLATQKAKEKGASEVKTICLRETYPAVNL